MADREILVAGVGNIFLGDDGFGVETAQRLAGRSWPAGVAVVDFGIRSYDLAFALVDGWRAAILIDALARGEAPGTMYVLEPDLAALDALSPAAIEGHSLHPAQVLRLAGLYGSLPGRILVVGCEPAALEFDEEGGAAGLSQPVQAAVAAAVDLVESLVNKLYAGERAVLPT